MFSVSFSGNSLNEGILFFLVGLPSRSYKPLKMKRHTKFPEKQFWWIEFTVQFSICNYPRNGLHRSGVFRVWVLGFFKSARRASLEESLFSKVIGEISTLYNSVRNSITCTGVFQKVVLLEISRNLQFATLVKQNPNQFS